MRVCPLFAVTAAALTAMNIAEPTGNSAYASGTTYSAGQQVVYSQYSYVSLQGSNLGHQPDTNPTWWAKLGPQPYQSGTTYAVGDVVSYNHRTYVSDVASNVGHEPDVSASQWTDTGPRLTWAPFDSYSTTQAAYPTTVDFTVQLAGTIDTLALFNCSALQVEVIITSPTSGVVYDETFSLVSTSGIVDAWGYCFYPIQRKADLILTNLPPFANCTVRVVLTDTAGATVKVGTFAAGMSFTIGDTQYGAQLGIQDYSTKSADSYGNYTIVEKAFAKRATYNVIVQKDWVDQAHVLLSSYRATPTLYVGADEYAASAMIGFFKDFTTVVSYPEVSFMSLEVEGLT